MKAATAVWAGIFVSIFFIMPLDISLILRSQEQSKNFVGPVNVISATGVNSNQTNWESLEPTHCVRYVSDVTIPDNSQVQLDQPIEKTWRVHNCGSNWQGPVYLARVVGSGAKIESRPYVQVSNIPSGQDGEVTIVITPKGSGYGVQWFEFVSGSEVCKPDEQECQVRFGMPLSVVINAT